MHVLERPARANRDTEVLTFARAGFSSTCIPKTKATVSIKRVRSGEFAYFFPGPFFSTFYNSNFVCCRVKRSPIPAETSK